MASWSTDFIRHLRKPKRVRSDIRDWSHAKRVRHFINLGSDKWRAEQLATAYGRQQRPTGGSYE